MLFFYYFALVLEVKMKKKGKITGAFLIGFFVIFGFILLGFSVIWFGSSMFFRENIYYVTYFVGSVEGISKGTPVKYLGVPVGSVYNIQLAPDGRMIEVVMVLGRKIEPSDSLRVKIELSGLTGGRFLQMFYTSDSTILQWHPKIHFEPPYTLIYSAPSGIETFEAGFREAIGKIMEFQFKEVSSNIVRFLATATEFFDNEDLYFTVSNLKETSERLNSIVTNADTSKIISQLEDASRNIVRVTKKLENFADSLQFELTNANIHNRIDRTFTKADSFIDLGSATIYSLGTRIEIASYSLAELVNSLKRTNSMLLKLIREYSQNPGQLLFSEPPPPEK